MAYSNLLKSLKIGQTLMVETDNEILIGSLKLIGVDGRIIELEDARDFKTNYIYTSSQILPLPQIKTIQIVKQDDDNEVEKGDSFDKKPSINSTSTDETWSSPQTSPSPSSSSTTSLLPEKAQRCLEKSYGQTSNGVHSKPRFESHNVIQPCAINLNNRELMIIQDQLDSVVYIYQTDQKYHKALADIKTQSAISVVLEPLSHGRHNQTSLIAVGTNRTVYIFDILNLGRIFRELKDILEAKRPRKALHDGRLLLDNLHYRQNIDLGGVFDTFVAHCLLTGANDPISLVETVLCYYNIPALYFAEPEVENLTSQINNDYFKRPLPKSLMQLLAKKVVFQYMLYEHLLHEQMLGNFYQQCEKFTHSFSSNTDSVEVVLQMNPNNSHGFEQIKDHEPWSEFLDKHLE